jgi:hypothetical protein
LAAVKEGPGGVDAGLEIFGKPSVAADPGKEPPLKPWPHGLPVILLDSPGGSVAEGLNMSDVLMSKKAHTVVPQGARCASACASILFIAGENRTVEVGGLLGQHSCSRDGVRAERCNEMVSRNAVSKGVSYGSISAFITYADPKDIIWFDRQSADCHGITRYPLETQTGFQKSEPCVIKVITGRLPAAQSVWRADFENEGYRAFLRPIADHLREGELSLFCNDHIREALFLSMDIEGPEERIKSAIVGAALDAPPIEYLNTPFLVSQVDDRYSCAAIQIPKQDVSSFLTKVDVLKFSLTLKQPYKPISVTTHLARSRPALKFAAKGCVNSK